MREKNNAFDAEIKKKNIFSFGIEHNMQFLNGFYFFVIFQGGHSP